MSVLLWTGRIEEINACVRIRKIMSLKLDIINIRFFIALGCIFGSFLFTSCKKELTLQEKICAKYVGRNIILPSYETLINKDCVKSENETYKLIHIIEFTCKSCLETLTENFKYISELKVQGVSLELVGYSTYMETEFSPVLLQYPFHFDYNREFSYVNGLKNDDITRTFLVKGNEVIAVGNLNDSKFREYVLDLI